MKKALRWLDVNFEPLCMSITFFLMAGLITIQVILRFVFQSGFPWGEEISRFIFVWLVFLSIPYAARNGRHIGIDFLRERLPETARRIIMLIIDVGSIVLFAFLLKGSIAIVQHAAEYGDNALTLSISMNWLHVAAVVGYILMEVRLLQSLIWKITHFKSSYELFRNTNGRYSHALDLFFMPASEKELEMELVDPALVQEEEERKNKKRGDIA